MEQVFALWPSLAQLAADLRKPYPTVAAWKQRGSIPAKYDSDLIRAASARGKSLTADDLVAARSAAYASQPGDAA